MVNSMRRRPRFWSFWLLAAAAVFFSGGCNQNRLGRVAISGSVIFRGKPLERGTIDFRPVAGFKSVGSGANIANGDYQIAALQGVPPGKYEVRIFCSKADTRPRPPGPPGAGSPPAIEQIPPQFNTKTEQTVEITAAGPNRFDFDIPAE
jgi:hypothetical protein